MAGEHSTTEPLTPHLGTRSEVTHTHNTKLFVNHAHACTHINFVATHFITFVLRICELPLVLFNGSAASLSVQSHGKLQLNVKSIRHITFVRIVFIFIASTIFDFCSVHDVLHKRRSIDCCVAHHIASQNMLTSSTQCYRR